MREARQFIRTEVSLRASYESLDETNHIFSATILNISANGFCFTSAQKLKEGKNVRLTVDFDNTDQSMIIVKVIWQKLNPNTGLYTIGGKIVEDPKTDYEKFLISYCKKIANQYQSN